MPELPAVTIFGTSFVVGLSGAASPGPLLAYNIRATVQRGFLAGPVVALGHSTLELLVVVLLAFGITKISESSPMVAFIGVVGGTFLLWMGSRMLRNPTSGAPDTETRAHSTGHGNLVVPFLGGIAVSLSNPFWTIWWITIGAAFMTESLELGILGISAFYLGHILSDFGWYSLVSAGLASGRRFITPRIYKGIMQACGAFLIALGLFFIATGLGKLG